MTAPIYPVGLRVDGVAVLVVGAGSVALDKIRGLLECGALVTVVAPDVVADIEQLPVTIARREYRRSDLDGVALVLTATNVAEVNQTVAADARAAGLWVNSADDPANCSFTLPSRVRRGDLLVTFATNGRSPALARWLRTHFEAELGPEYETLLEVLSEAREELRAAGRVVDAMSWQRALDSGMLEAVRNGRVADAKETLHACLS